MLKALLFRPADWQHGYELAKLAGISSGTLYPLLIRLHERGILESRWEASDKPGRPARHVYRLSHAGAAFARSLDLNGAEAAAPAGREVLA